MGGGGSQEIAHIYSHVNEYKRPVLTRVSSFVFGENLPEFVSHVSEDMMRKAPDGTPYPSPTGKIGIQLETSQKVCEFRLLFEGQGYATQFDPVVVTELKETFGDPPHMEWHGYTVSLPPPTDRFTMAALLRIDVNFHKRPRTNVDGGIYAVAMVFGFFNIPFSRHYALGVTTLQPDATTMVDTSVRLRI